MRGAKDTNSYAKIAKSPESKVMRYQRGLRPKK